MIHYQDNLIELRQGHVIPELRSLPSESVHCVVTSPPYWGLRNYGLEPQVWDDGWKGSLGLEPDPDLYIRHLVQVFREIWRVGRKDFTCWVNIGNSYQDKQLQGIPWRVALALQQPHVKPSLIKSEIDKSWLAGFMDGEGTISIRRHDSYSNGEKRPACQDGFVSFISAGNNDRELLDRCVEITTYGKVGIKDRPTVDDRGIKSRRTYYGWRLDGNKAIEIIVDIYPYLIAKRKQAILAYNLDISNKSGRALRGNKRLPASEQEKREYLKKLINDCNQREPVDIPSWCVEPKAVIEPGWYLRSAMPWVKRTSMPESVTDRPASALEYVFLLSKSANYYFDMEAIKITASPDSHRRYARGRSDSHKYSNGGPGDQTITRTLEHRRKRPGVTPKSAPRASGIKANEDFHANMGDLVGSRNFRNTDLFFESIEPPYGMIFVGDEPVGMDITPQSFKGAHFATFPEKLASTCIRAGSSEKGCCPECGAPWVRMVEKNFIPQQDVSLERGVKGAPGQKSMDGSSSWDGVPRGSTESTTIDWKPSCDCQEIIEVGHGIGKETFPYDPIPCTILDPFAGSCRALIVGKKLGRHGIGIDLKGEYLEMAKKELRQEVFEFK